MKIGPKVRTDLFAVLILILIQIQGTLYYLNITLGNQKP